jgi:hypothetical protein
VCWAAATVGLRRRASVEVGRCRRFAVQVRHQLEGLARVEAAQLFARQRACNPRQRTRGCSHADLWCALYIGALLHRQQGTTPLCRHGYTESKTPPPPHSPATCGALTSSRSRPPTPKRGQPRISATASAGSDHGGGIAPRARGSSAHCAAVRSPQAEELGGSATERRRRRACSGVAGNGPRAS